MPVVVDAVDEARELQHVVGHALAPLSPRGGARQRLAQRLRGVGERLRAAPGLRELAGELPRVLAAFALDLLDQRAEPVEVGAHLDRARGR